MRNIITSIYNTEFGDQIRIEYLENIITCEKLFLNFEEKYCDNKR